MIQIAAVAAGGDTSAPPGITVAADPSTVAVNDSAAAMKVPTLPQRRWGAPSDSALTDNVFPFIQSPRRAAANDEHS
jgi:hypothetical protein